MSRIILIVCALGLIVTGLSLSRTVVSFTIYILGFLTFLACVGKTVIEAFDGKRSPLFDMAAWLWRRL